ncbi:restriction endonuclease subunit S [Mesomycoplasma ovipneumoniae]|uniref:restriction endonuclease subunit S n=1 Tax=Mesomycoplasma ovipneumoniae TaxID=29562 RepID=UPI0029645D2F|nr:restriction endonuclease subunit S [Mesomycoplasma ovipneumoniae]MDW2912204.1 restriction endonuclease subunit S [Mesomycoplasma ovipneumoniae]MDW2919964.1 restriction endonuclease subunit S [Mesomycoplasma ovipneumoniae]
MNKKPNTPLVKFKNFNSVWISDQVKNLFDISRGQFLTKDQIKSRPVERERERESGYIYPVYSSQTENHGILGYYKEFLAENIITWTADGVNAGFVNFRKGKFFATSHCGMLISKKYPENEFFAIAIGLRSKKWVSRSIVPCLKTDDIAQVELKFTTDISEQQKISQLFDTFENLVKKLEEKIHLLKDLKNNLTKKMFTDLSLDFPLIRFKGLTQPWKTEQISDLFQTYKNKNSNNLKLISYSVSNKFGFVSQKQLFKKGGKAVFADKRNSQIITKNSFGFNPTAIQIGSLALYKNSMPGLISPMYEVFKLKKDYNSDYFLIWFKTEIFKKLMLKSTNKSVRHIFRLNEIEKYFIKVADTVEQEKIAKLFETFDSLIAAYEQKAEYFKNLKTSFITKMFVY